jgi:hypothetical protein
MARKPGDAKKLLVDDGPGAYKAPTAMDWKRLERVLGSPLPEPLRDEISLITERFATGGWSSKHTLSNTKLKGDLDSWQRRTKILRKKIWSGEAIKLNQTPTRADLINAFFRWPDSVAEQPFARDQLHTMPLLAFALDAALATSDLIIREVSDPRLRSDRGSGRSG